MAERKRHKKPPLLYDAAGRPVERDNQSLPKPKIHKPIPPKTPPRQPKARKRFWQLVGAAATIIALGEFAYSFRPQIRIDRDISVNEKDPFATVFIISNIGRIALNDLVFDCVLNAPPMVTNARAAANGKDSRQVLNQRGVNVLAPGDRVTKYCGFAGPNFPLNATIDFDVGYSVWGLGRRAASARFISEKDGNGITKWLVDPR
jgi:hypothetical protein